MGLLTNDGQVQAAIDFYNVTTHWGAIARTTMEWTIPSAPPTEVATTTDLDDNILGYKKILPAQKQLCKLDNSNGTIIFKNNKYTPVSVGNAFTQGAKYLYVEFSFDYDEVSTANPFRQVGIYRDITPAAGFESNVLLTPAQVEGGSARILIYYDNIVAEARFANKRNVIRRILSF